MPLTSLAQQWSPYSATSQSQAASEQTALAWIQGGWQQQQLEDGPCWIRVDGINANEAVDSEQNEDANCRPNGLPSPASWSGRPAQQNTEKATCAQTNGSMAEWAAPEHWQTSMYTSMYNMPNNPVSSPTFPDGAGQMSTTLPLFQKSSDLHLPQLPSASSSSFSPEWQTSSFQFDTAAEPEARRTSLKRSPSSKQSGIAIEVKRAVKPKPKRGRPRLPRNEPHICSHSPCEHVIEETGSRRIPHNQVEQKYRIGLNAELERLRETVAVAPSRAFAHLSSSSAKPSKAMVLASAIDYIKSIEAERDRLAEENQVLRGRNKRLRKKKAAGNE